MITGYDCINSKSGKIGNRKLPLSRIRQESEERNACNQKNNREPVMRVDQADVEVALKSLRNQHFVWQIMTHGSRTAKYEHNMVEKVRCSERELSVLCELFLRGPQTPGELNTRTARLIESHGLIVIEQTLKKLLEHENGPFVVMLSRLQGHKENRYVHLFCSQEQSEIIYQPTVKVPASRVPRVSAERVEELEKKVNDLEELLEDLKNQFLSFKQQFE